MEELESLFVEGLEIDYNYPLESIPKLCAMSSSRKFTARAMLMLVTRDHPAQCKIGSFKEGGQSFCRRCKAIFQADEDTSSGYVYDENRKQFRYPPSRCQPLESLDAISEFERATTEMEREAIRKKSGLSGVSPLWRFYNLYGFNPHLDLVYDCMHILSLNMFSKYINALMMALSNEVKNKIDDAIDRMSKWVPASIRYGWWPRLPRIPASSDVALRAPSYDDIFCPPKGKDRDPNKLYGKELLEKKYPPEYHAIMLDNYRTVRRWFHDYSLPTYLRHNKKGKDKIMQSIQKNYVQIKVLKFVGASYKWQLEDIYKWVVDAKQSKQKYSKTKKKRTLTSKKKKMNLLLSIMGHREHRKNKAENKEKEVFSHFSGLSKTDKFLLEMKSFENLQSYHEEDGDALVNDLPISYTELLHSGQSKRVQAMHDPLPSKEVLKSNKMTEKMKSFCELDIVRKKDGSSKEETRSKHVKSVGNDALLGNLLD
ncbi:hypothetical protein L7F22_052165 [Adiantum nelumboides]|nr:hypothetical protein [Adiantum nelumboides]